jgi:endonuclease/exonuclease/phosphatase family metal-dependent hydrolase
MRVWPRVMVGIIGAMAAALGLALALAPAAVTGLPPADHGVGQEPGVEPAPVLRVVSYNIRHGRGMDDEVDLARTAGVLGRLKPDIVALQEVDDRAERSGGVPQAQELGRLLDMQWAFGKFMDFQGGGHGMATLSRYPILRQEDLLLPEGNEPRVALLTEIQLPGGERVLLVNIHFDWVRDDGFRFAQASYLARYLDDVEIPWILVGDLNDQPGSRTWELFHSLALEARKPEGDRSTFSSTDPRREIDFVFVAPAARWEVGRVEVIHEPLASDHRPVVAELRLLPGAQAQAPAPDAGP